MIMIVEYFSLVNIYIILNIDKSFNEFWVLYEVLYKILRILGKNVLYFNWLCYYIYIFKNKN